MAKLPNEVKQIIHEEERDNPDYVMTRIKTIPSFQTPIRICYYKKEVYILLIFKQNIIIRRKS